MDSDRKDYLHWSSGGAHALLEALQLDSVTGLSLAAILTILVCFTERYLNMIHGQHRKPRFVLGSNLRSALWRAALYWILTFLRLTYMLIVMSFHAGLMLLTITSLAAAQFWLELSYPSSEPNLQSRHGRDIEEPLLLRSDCTDTPPQEYRLPAARPRQKPKPEGIFIHPNLSNIARADARAMERGLIASTDRVHSSYSEDKESGWQSGQGQEAARALLGSTDGRHDHTPGSDSD